MKHDSITAANNSRIFLFFISIIFISPSAFASEDIQRQFIESAVKKTVEEAIPKALEDAATEKEAIGSANDQAIMSKYFGAGIMANFDFTKGGERVRSARVVGGVVRVEESSKSQVGFMLEAHKFLSTPPDEKSKTVYGPFIGLVMQDQGSVDTAIIGCMWGFRQPKTTQTLNLGVGISVSPRAQVLGDGITEGAALPNGETEVRFKHITKYGLAIIASFGF